MTAELEYVLGTADAEIRRLGMQHAVWRSDATRAWRIAGFRPGSTIIDVGCGPGFAALDLAELVGPTGRVHAIDQSARFTAYLDVQAAARGIANIATTTADLDDFEFDALSADGAWIRWVLAFVHEPRQVLSRLAKALRSGGRVVIHEYFAYETWRVLPRDEDFERLVSIVMRSWRDRGGEPNVGLEIVPWLEAIGFRILVTRTIAHLSRSDDPRWHWPTTFALSGIPRLVELGELTSDEATQLDARLRTIFAANVWMFTPSVLEVVAEWA
ncbi:MAG TPA: methyltransferase domain-containing protein [Gemmatimonadaceae bacterium]|jgi:SAM-dependent methyltransferase|nr:methyltransferase domain-containing protein [Gemmatimonadaceae bacterium]